MTEGPIAQIVAAPNAGWTVETYAIHNEALRSAEWKFQQERDRRYAEVGQEREKALAIKEKADEAALGLAREIQTYKDEKANELRAQINSERGLYATRTDLVAAIEKIEATIKPVVTYTTGLQGRGEGAGTTVRYAAIAIGAVAAFLSIVSILIALHV